MVVIAIALGSTLPACAEDSDLTRYYFSLRYGEITPGLVKAHDVAGGSIGFNYDGHIGLELAIDSYDVKIGEVAELSVIGVVPLARLRYPLLDDRLVPYAIAGAGLAVTQGNDARAEVQWAGGKNGVQPAGTLGGGIEYFIADNLAVGLEGKYFASGDIVYETGGQLAEETISSALVALGVRVFYPLLHQPEAGLPPPFWRLYAAVRMGAVLPVHREPFPGVHATPEQAVFGTNFNTDIGATVGATLGRHAAVELALDNYELRLALPGVGGIGEYALFPIAVQGRLRWPLMAGRVEPYVLGGVGAEYAQLNDRTAAGNELVLYARDVSVIGVLGAGIEYELMPNVAIGATAKYIISRGHTFQVEPSAPVDGNLDSFFLSVGLTILILDG